MSPDIIQAAGKNTWVTISPEIALGCLALFLLVLEIVLPKKQHAVIPTLAIVGQLGLLIGFVWNLHGVNFVAHETFNGLLRHTQEGQFMRVFFMLSSVLVSILGVVALAKQKMPKIEIFAITMMVSPAMMLLAHALLKAALFFVVGVVDHTTGTRDLRDLSGLRRAAPAVWLVALPSMNFSLERTTTCSQASTAPGTVAVGSTSFSRS